MTETQESHLQSIKDKVIRDLDIKYRRGQGEHGGDVWTRDIKKDILEESIDLIVYAYTNEYKIRQATNILNEVISHLYGKVENESTQTLVLQAIEILNVKKNNK